MDIKDVWESLTYDQKLAATAYVFGKLCDHARESGSFRSLIYDKLGFGEDAYILLYSAGGMHISNEFKLPKKQIEAKQVVEADAKKCTRCGRVMYEATFCQKCNIIGSARTA